MSWKRLFDDLMEAATFAEADLPDAARVLATRIFPDAGEQRTSRILAVGTAAGFSAAMVERSVAMAERLEYGLVAMTAGSVPACGRPSGPRPLEGAAFGAKAAERGVPFSHVAWLGDPAEGVAEAARNLRRIAFLLVEADLASRVRIAPGGIPIFCVEG
jgi:hypothetical protein